MLKLNASYSKKVPAEAEYSSKSYHCAVEVELPDGLTPAQLRERIHETFDLVRDSVESELHDTETDTGTSAVPFPTNGRTAQPFPRHNAGSDRSRRQPQSQRSEPASQKQMQYLLTLGKRQGLEPGALAAMAGVSDLAQIGRTECSRLIDQLSSANRNAA